MGKHKKYWLFFTKPLKYRQIYYKSNLGKTINHSGQVILDNETLALKMKAIHKFYFNELESYCLSNQLDPMDELQIRKIELGDDEMVAPVSLLSSLILGIISSLAMNYMNPIFSFSSTSPFSDLIFYILGFCILFYGLLWVYYLVYASKTYYPKGKILREYELKIRNRAIRKKRKSIINI